MPILIWMLAHVGLGSLLYLLILRLESFAKAAANRKSHMVFTNASGFNAKQQFTRSDFRFFPWGGVELYVRWSKTIQFREGKFLFPSHGSLVPPCALSRLFFMPFPSLPLHPRGPKPLCGFIPSLCACSPSRIVCFCLNSGTF